MAHSNGRLGPAVVIRPHPAFRLFAIAGLAGSNGEARRLIRGGGARINDMPVKDEGHAVTVADLHGDAIKLSAGRKQHRLVRAA